MHYGLGLVNHEFMFGQLGGVIPGFFSGAILGHSGIILGSFRDHSGVILGSFRDHSGVILGSFPAHSGIIPVSFQGLLCGFRAGSAPAQKIHSAGSSR